MDSDVTDSGATEAVSLAEAFTREHRDIDTGIEEFLAAQQDAGEGDVRERARPLLRAMEALRRHIYLEEEIVFPHIDSGPLMMPVMVMLREHGQLWQEMDALAATLGAPADGAENADVGTAGVEDACHRLLSLLEDHNSKEEPVIYPHLDADLDPEEQDRVRRLLESGTLPEGWVCRRA